MRKGIIISSCLISCAIVMIVGGLTASSAFGLFSVDIDQRLEKACHKAIKKRVPIGHRDLETTTYRLEDENIGIVEGVLMAQYDQTHWAKVAWTCRINPKNGIVSHSEVRSASAGRRDFF